MKLRTILTASAATAALTIAGAASAETMRIGITQNNVGVDSYQTTYEKAFIAAAVGLTGVLGQLRVRKERSGAGLFTI